MPNFCKKYKSACFHRHLMLYNANIWLDQELNLGPLQPKSRALYSHWDYSGRYPYSPNYYIHPSINNLCPHRSSQFLPLAEVNLSVYGQVTALNVGMIMYIYCIQTFGWTGNWTWDPSNSRLIQADIPCPYSPNYYNRIKYWIILS